MDLRSRAVYERCIRGSHAQDQVIPVVVWGRIKDVVLICWMWGIGRYPGVWRWLNCLGYAREFIAERDHGNYHRGPILDNQDRAGIGANPERLGRKSLYILVALVQRLI